MTLKQFLVFHPFLFAVFPILFLFAYNIDEVPATDLLLPIVVVIIGTLILLLSLRLITKSYNKIGIITSYFLILFFSYGHIRDVIFEPRGAKAQLEPNLFMASLWAFLFITVAFLIIRSRRNFSIFTKFLNIVAISLVAISLINIGIYEVKTFNLMPETTSESPASLNLENSRNLPDIYYIILDRYLREDTLKEVFNYDNSGFINYLTNKGFYVATKSRSNYGETIKSMASSLNMDYYPTAEEQASSPFDIRNNKVSQLLKSVGYRYIFVGGNWDWKDMYKYADVYSYHEAFGIRVSKFAQALSDTTALSPFARVFGSLDTNAILYAFDVLADIPNIEEPTFVYAHILSPHPPYVFDSDGPRKINIFGPAVDPKEGYLGNLIFINKKVKTLVDEIISKSDVPPIIILQGDHGRHWTKASQRFEILNAYYLPGRGNRLLYETITPVNSFRIVFNLYFDTDYELLKDERN